MEEPPVFNPAAASVNVSPIRSQGEESWEGIAEEASSGEDPGGGILREASHGEESQGMN